MADDSQKRVAPVTGERLTPAERVKQIQEMQRAAGSAPVAKPAAPVAASTATVGPAFTPAPVSRAALDGHQPIGATQAAYGKAQVDTGSLFGGGAAEITGNPWKVISFATMLPVVFEPPKPLAQYEAKVPANAVKTDEGLLFGVTLSPKDGASEKPLTRAVLTDAKGALTGVESRNAGELRSLLGRAPALAQGVFASAFGHARMDAKVANIAAGKSGGYQVTVASGKETRSVLVNNFGQPVRAGARAHVDVAEYNLDKFEAI